MHAFHVMAKPTGSKCNLDCDYCYYLEKQALYPAEGKFRMRRDVLETFIRDYIASQFRVGQREISFAWQGGEPTLLGLEYFQTIVSLQKQYCPPGCAITNALQTNGTLLNSAWARFLHQESFLVGLSIDGPPPLHDRYRHDRRGLPSSSRVLNAWQLLRRHEVQTNVLCVVNRQNAEHPLEVYRYLRDLGVEFMQFIPLVERTDVTGRLSSPPNTENMDDTVAPWSVRPEDYGRFLCAIFDEWLRHDVGKVFVQLFDMQLGVWLGQPASLCVFAETCGSGLAIEHNGDLFACDHYVYPEYKLGNIQDTDIGELADAPKQMQFGLDKKMQLPQVCRECKWRFACHGGCPKHRFLGEQNVNYFCQSNRLFFEHAAPYLQTMAQLLRRGQPAGHIMNMVRSPGPERRI
ncbi:anaerobic sulfatase maturase [Alcaligenaceae bacterium]|nr:anaerobic sulfatase maturase [Alcaligenaceae bacterium]